MARLDLDRFVGKRVALDSYALTKDEFFAKAQDPGFYAFQRRLETYERIFGDGTTIVLRPDSDLLRYLKTPRVRR